LLGLVYLAGICKANHQRVLLIHKLLHSNEPLKWLLKKPVFGLLV
jgi:hypothetical protein